MNDDNNELKERINLMQKELEKSNTLANHNLLKIMQYVFIFIFVMTALFVKPDLLDKILDKLLGLIV